jgi:hypothetical protein
MGGTRASGMASGAALTAAVLALAALLWPCSAAAVYRQGEETRDSTSGDTDDDDGDDDDDEGEGEGEHPLADLDIENHLRFGLHSSHGNVESWGLTVGLDRGRSRGAWQHEVDLDGSLVRLRGVPAEDGDGLSAGGDGGSGSEDLVEGHLEGALRRRVGRRAHGIAALRAEHDPASGVESDLTANVGLGASWTRGHRRLRLEGGAGYGWEHEDEEPTVGTRHLWARQHWTLVWAAKAQLEQHVAAELDLDDEDNLQASAAVDLLIRLSARLGLHTTVRLSWDNRPPSGYEALDVRTATALSVVLRAPAGDD